MQDQNTDTSVAETGQDVTGEIDISPKALVERLDNWVDSAIALLPNIVLGILVFLLFWWISGIAKRQVTKRFADHERPSLGLALGRIAKIAFFAAGVALSLILIAPSIDLQTLVASLGIGSVAIGFAFKDIFQNWLAGMLLLIRKPFTIGDQIEVGGFEGTIEEIETRATVIKTYAGEHVLIPNSQLYTSPVVVKTRTSLTRGEYTIGISYDADIDEALSLMEAELAQINGVMDEPKPDAFAWELGESSVNIKARWWTKAERAEQVRIRGEAVRAIKYALDKAGIEIPFPHVVRMDAKPSDVANVDMSADINSADASASSPS